VVFELRIYKTFSKISVNGPSLVTFEDAEFTVNFICYV
jgi:hypothetical protein